MIPYAGQGHRIDLTGVSHQYGPVVALADVSLSIEPRELVALLGPSGCGKTTLLKIIAGFVFPTSGDIQVDGHSITKLQPAERKVGIVFQNYALFPHMTVARNVSYGLRAGRMRPDEVEARVREMLILVKMVDHGNRYPGELSGGQQQRVALARALAVRPRIMLLDEPFSALDRGLRLDMQIEVKGLLKEYGVTSILVTHDQEEALSMADRIVVLREGRVEQIGTAADLYDRPRTLFVNRFLGQTNLLPGRLRSTASRTLCVELESGTLLAVSPSVSGRAGDRIYVSIRPENLAVAPVPAASTIEAKVVQFVPLGATDVTELTTQWGTPLKIARPHRRDSDELQSGQTVHLKVEDPAGCVVFPDYGEMDAGPAGKATIITREEPS